jgi:hypothetical protein
MLMCSPYPVNSLSPAGVRAKENPPLNGENSWVAEVTG